MKEDIEKAVKSYEAFSSIMREFQHLMKTKPWIDAGSRSVAGKTTGKRKRTN